MDHEETKSFKLPTNEKKKGKNTIQKMASTVKIGNVRVQMIRLADLPRIHLLSCKLFLLNFFSFFFWFSSVLSYVQKSSLSLSLKICIEMRIGARAHT